MAEIHLIHGRTLPFGLFHCDSTLPHSWQNSDQFMAAFSQMAAIHPLRGRSLPYLWQISHNNNDFVMAELCLLHIGSCESVLLQWFLDMIKCMFVHCFTVQLHIMSKTVFYCVHSSHSPFVHCLVVLTLCCRQVWSISLSVLGTRDFFTRPFW